MQIRNRSTNVIDYTIEGYPLSNATVTVESRGMKAVGVASHNNHALAYKIAMRRAGRNLRKVLAKEVELMRK